MCWSVEENSDLWLSLARLLGTEKALLNGVSESESGFFVMLLEQTPDLALRFLHSADFGI